MEYLSKIFEVGLEVGLSVFLGIISSWTFLLILYRKYRPKVDISTKICKYEYEGRINYFFKFVNKSSHNIFDVQIELGLVKEEHIAGEEKNIYRLKDIPLVKDNIFNIPSKSLEDHTCSHAQIVRTTEDLETLLGDGGNYVVLDIIARHGLSGLSEVFSCKFSKRTIKEDKKFGLGDNLGIE